MASGSRRRQTRCSDGIVFLDLDTGIYSCCYDPSDREDAAVSLVIESDGPLLWRNLPSCPPPPMRIVDIIRFGAAFIATAVRLAHFSFRGLAHREIDLAPSARAAQNPEDPLVNVVNRFERLVLWLPMRDKCLFRSAFLIDFLGRYGLRGDWIFGVSLFPFGAHCWVADGDLLLGERVHKIARYRPIFMAGHERR